MKANEDREPMLTLISTAKESKEDLEVLRSGSVPDSLKGRFSTRSQLSNYRLKKSLDIDVPRQNLEFSKRSFYYSAAKAWNEIPLNIRQSPTICTFKKKLKDFYSIANDSQSTIPT